MREARPLRGPAARVHVPVAVLEVELHAGTPRSARAEQVLTQELERHRRLVPAGRRIGERRERRAAALVRARVHEQAGLHPAAPRERLEHLGLPAQQPVVPLADDEHRHLDLRRVVDGRACPVERIVVGPGQVVERDRAGRGLAELGPERLLEQRRVGVRSHRARRALDRDVLEVEAEVQDAAVGERVPVEVAQRDLGHDRLEVGWPLLGGEVLRDPHVGAARHPHASGRVGPGTEVLREPVAVARLARGEVVAGEVALAPARAAHVDGRSGDPPGRPELGGKAAAHRFPSVGDW